MEKTKRGERLAVITKYLAENPGHLFPLAFFTELFHAAKSSVSEDLSLLKELAEHYGAGKIETVAGAAGGVKFIPSPPEAAEKSLLDEVCRRLKSPERFVPGGFLYMTDLIFNPEIIMPLGRVFASRFGDKEIDYVITIETKGIPLAFSTAWNLNKPLVIVRDEGKITEGSTVSINYVSGSSSRIRTMALSRRAIPAGARVLFIDDFMKGGGTARGIFELMEEFQASVEGVGVLIGTTEPRAKLVQDYLALLHLVKVDEETREIVIEPNPDLWEDIS